VPLVDAAQACNTLNMTLWAADNVTKIKPMLSMISSKEFTCRPKKTTFIIIYIKFSGKFPAQVDYWTSGANEGEFCVEEQAFSWCSTGKLFRKADVLANWAAAAKDSTATERFLTLKLSKTVDFELAPAASAGPLPYICEVFREIKVLKS